MSPFRAVSVAGRNVLVDVEDMALVQMRPWTVDPSGYVSFHERNGRVIYLHRLIARPPKGREVHHVNGCKLDNRRENLQALTPGDHAGIHQEQADAARAEAYFHAKHGRYPGYGDDDELDEITERLEERDEREDW